MLLYILLQFVHIFKACHAYPSDVSIQKSQNTGSQGTTGSTVCAFRMPSNEK